MIADLLLVPSYVEKTGTQRSSESVKPEIVELGSHSGYEVSQMP